MELLTELLALNENKIVDRRVLKMIEKALLPLGRGVKLTKAEESRNSVEGEGTFEKKPSAAEIKKAEKALEDLGFKEFLQGPDFPGMTVMGAEIEINARFARTKGDNVFTFFIEFDDR